MAKRLWVSILMAALLIIGQASTALGVGESSFLYHRGGYSVTPTYKYYWILGDSQSGSPPLVLPPTGRKFAPEQQKVAYSTSNNYSIPAWNVQVDWDWTNNAGADFSFWNQYKPFSGKSYFLMETHVRRGWLWQGYYQENIPGPVKTHILGNAIYKPDHVEADVWTESPENFQPLVNHKMGWTFTPDTGQDFNTLSRSYGNAFKVTIYDWTIPADDIPKIQASSGVFLADPAVAPEAKTLFPDKVLEIEYPEDLAYVLGSAK